MISNVQLVYHVKIGNLNYDNDDGNENVTWKYNFILFVLHRDYFNSSKLYKNSELPKNQIGRRGVRVKKEDLICIAQLVHAKKEHSDWLPERSKFSYTER